MWFYGPHPCAFPPGFSRVPFVWDCLGTKLAMEFAGGFMGVSQDSETFTVRPELGWAVLDKTIQ